MGIYRQETTPRWNHAVVFLQLALNTIVGYGFARMLANMYGISATKDGFDIAYSVPFIILNLSGFAFGHAVVSTHFSKLRVENPEKLQPSSLTTTSSGKTSATSSAMRPYCRGFSPSLNACLKRKATGRRSKMRLDLSPMP